MMCQNIHKETGPERPAQGFILLCPQILLLSKFLAFKKKISQGNLLTYKYNLNVLFYVIALRCKKKIINK